MLINNTETVKRAALDALLAGYAFLDNALTDEALEALQREIRTMQLERETAEDNIVYGRGTHHEVRQDHSRSYVLMSEPWHVRLNTPHLMGHLLSLRLQATLCDLLPSPWILNELGYQRYEPGVGFISAHRDRRSDRILSVTVTISGQAPVSVLRPGPGDSYVSGTSLIEQHICGPGSLFFLKAPDANGVGEQVLHEVGVPEPLIGPREILNMRMRDVVLPGPR